MKIIPTQSVKELDAYTMVHEPIESIQLMERAAAALTCEIARHWNTSTPFVVFAGPGNNGGDALAVARMLFEKGYRVKVFLLNPKGRLSKDCEVNSIRLQQHPDIDFTEVTNQFAPPALTRDMVVVDGLFGSGLNKPLGGGYAGVVKYINASAAQVVSIDIPSGLMGEDNSENVYEHIVKADLTLTLQLPKLAFFFPENAPYVGEWRLVDIGLHPDAIRLAETDWQLAEKEDMPYLLEVRDKFAHKGDFGRAMLVAGKQGMAGASILSARACLRSGVGLLTVHIPAGNNVILQTAVPEAMVSTDVHAAIVTDIPPALGYDAVGVGPGIGTSEETTTAFLDWIGGCTCPMVVDADALNILATHRSYIGYLPKGSILTPHPKEFERLVGNCGNSYERMTKAIDLAKRTGVTLVLKGAYSMVVSPSGECWLNTTGNPGMATGGSGDVLTGILLALLAQGYDTETAARLGVYVHGLAGDLAAANLGQTGLIAGDLVQYLPAAWKALEDY